MVQQPRADADERAHEVETEQMAPNHLLPSDDTEQAHALVLPDLTDVGENDPGEGQVEEVVGDDREGDDERLRDLDPVHASENVDRVGRKGR